MVARSVVGLVAVLSAVDICLAEYYGSLRLVNVIFRHGQRTPADTYPNDPHVNFDFHPFGWGQLTNEGRMQQYNQGQFLRKRYLDFLGDEFTTDKVKVQSTDVDRTMMSAQLEAAGLFPPVDYQKWNPNLNWQPIPIRYQALDEDSLLLVRIPCPRYNEELESVMKSPEVKPYLDSLQGLFAELTHHSGLTVDDPDDVQNLYSTMLAELQFNLTLPEWTRQYYPERLAGVTAYSFSLNVYNEELQKLKGGPLVKKILSDVDTKIKDPQSKQKMFMYAGHDSTVVNVMQTLKVWEDQIPIYNIMAIIELHEVDSIYGLTVFLRNTTEHEPYLLRLPGCHDFCPLDKVKEILKNVIPQNLEEECKSHDPNYVPPPPSGP